MPKASKDIEEDPDEEEEEPEEAHEAESVDEEDEEEGSDEDEVAEKEEPEEEEEEEDEEEQEEEEEEETTGSSKPSAKARSRQRKREERAKRARNQIVGAVIALIIIGAIAGAYFYTPAPSSVTVGTLNDVTNNGIELLVSASGGGVRGYSGPVEVTSTVNGSVTYNKKITMKENVAHLNLLYSDFVSQNGDYIFQVKVGGKKSTTTVTIDNVVEDISFQFGTRDIANTTPYKPLAKTIVTIYMTFIRWTSATKNTTVEARPGQTINIEIEDPGGHLNTKPDLDVSNKALIQYTYEASMRGTYNIKATFLNNHIKSDSSYWTIIRAKDLSVNAKPRAEAGADQTKVLLPGGTLIKVDGGASKDDGAIVLYEWNFGVYTDPDDPNFGKDTVNSTSPTAEWTYYTADAFTVTLTVKDNGIQGGSSSVKYDSDWLIVTI